MPGQLDMGALLQPDRAALEIAHRQLCVTTPLDAMLEQKPFRLILENVARAHMQRRAQFDAKKLQANDSD